MSMIEDLQSGRSHLHDDKGNPTVTGNVIQDTILQTSLQTGVLSKRTAFVAGESIHAFPSMTLLTSV